MPTKKKPKSKDTSSLFTHVAAKANVRSLQKLKNYSPTWLIPELHTRDPLYGLDLRAVIEELQKSLARVREEKSVLEKDLNYLNTVVLPALAARRVITKESQPTVNYTLSRSKLCTPNVKSKK